MLPLPIHHLANATLLSIVLMFNLLSWYLSCAISSVACRTRALNVRFNGGLFYSTLSFVIIRIRILLIPSASITNLIFVFYFDNREALLVMLLISITRDK